MPDQELMEERGDRRRAERRRSDPVALLRLIMASILVALLVGVLVNELIRAL